MPLTPKIGITVSPTSLECLIKVDILRVSCRPSPPIPSSLSDPHSFWLEFKRSLLVAFVVVVFVVEVDSARLLALRLCPPGGAAGTPLPG